MVRREGLLGAPRRSHQNMGCGVDPSSDPADKRNVSQEQAIFARHITRWEF